LNVLNGASVIRIDKWLLHFAELVFGLPQVEATLIATTFVAVYPA
jgi:hypothetical protein